VLQQKHTAFRVCPAAGRENRRMVRTQKPKLTTYTQNGAEQMLWNAEGWIRMNNTWLNHLYIYRRCNENSISVMQRLVAMWVLWGFFVFLGCWRWVFSALLL